MDKSLYPSSDAAMPREAKERLEVTAAARRAKREVEEETVSAIDPAAVSDEPGHAFPEPEPPPMSEPHPEYDPTPP
jgi:hypothetical protein